MVKTCAKNSDDEAAEQIATLLSSYRAVLGVLSDGLLDQSISCVVDIGCSFIKHQNAILSEKSISIDDNDEND